MTSVSITKQNIGQSHMLPWLIPITYVGYYFFCISIISAGQRVHRFVYTNVKVILRMLTNSKNDLK